MTDTKKIVFTALFAALISVGAYIVVPIGPVPITLQTLFITLAGLLGGRSIGLSSVIIYLLLGLVGLPVFSGGTGSLAHLIGPTGGYLFASIPAVYIAGLFGDAAAERTLRENNAEVPEVPNSAVESRKSMNLWSVILYSAGAAAAMIITYAVGVPWLKLSLGLPSWSKAFAVGMVPFIIGDLLKGAAAVILAVSFGPRVSSFLNKDA